MTKLFSIALALIGANFMAAQTSAAQDGDAERGGRLFRSQCSGCHINAGTAGRGPNLTDIVGGTPGVLYDFKYKSEIVFVAWGWNVERLDKYLKNPSAMFRGSTDASRVRSQRDRQDIIAYLKTLRTPEGQSPVRGRVKFGLDAMTNP